MRLVLKMLLFRVLNYLSALMLTAMLLAGVTVIAAWEYLESDLPETDVLRDIRLQVPLRVYSSAGDLIAEYGTKRREPVEYEEVPKPVEQAVLAAEDANFFRHPGVDYRGLARAVVSLVKTGQRKQGGSTITMQLAKNLFLTRGRLQKSFRDQDHFFLIVKILRKLLHLVYTHLIHHVQRFDLSQYPE